MNQSQDSDKWKRRAAFLFQLEADLYRNRGRLNQTSAYARRQHAHPVPPSAREPNASEVLQGVFSVVDVKTDDRYRQGIEHIQALRQAVYRLDVRIMGAWVLAIICIYFGRYLLALDLLGLVGGLFYLKFLRAAQARCPNCQSPFGSSQWLPTRLGGVACQYCGLLIEAFGNRQKGSS